MSWYLDGEQPGQAAFLSDLGSRDRGRHGVDPRGVVGHPGIAPAETEGLAGVGHGRAVVAEPRVGRAAAVVGIGIGRIELDRRFEVGQGQFG